MLTSSQEALFNCALECALRRRKRICKNHFDSYACNKCKFYVKNYVYDEPNHVQLYMLEVEREAERQNYIVKEDRFFHHFCFAFIIAILLFFYYVTDKQDKKYAANIPQGTVTNQSATASARASTEHDMINRALVQTSAELKKKTDVNSDKLVNCIDAAVLFYGFFPDKNKVAIIVNKNNSTGMHHLFNAVLIDGVWRAIEPQAYHAGHTVYWMRDIWGNQYDYNLNRVATNDYIKFVKK